MSLTTRAAEICNLQKIQFPPPKYPASDKIITKFQATQITFESEPSSPKSATPIFNLPVQVLTKSGKICRLGEGIWDLKDIYINKEEDILAGSECSGSECSLNFYSLSDCTKRDSILFAGPLRFESGRFLMRGACEYLNDAKSKGYCSPAKIYELGRSCQPTLNKKESLIWTKKIYGMEFSAPSNILNPHTPQAQVTTPLPE